MRAKRRVGQGPSVAAGIPATWGGIGRFVQRVGTGPVRGQETGRRKEKEKGKENGEKGKIEKERKKEKETPAGFSAAVASACSGFGRKRRARNEEEQGWDDD